MPFRARPAKRHNKEEDEESQRSSEKNKEHNSQEEEEDEQNRSTLWDWITGMAGNEKTEYYKSSKIQEMNERSYGVSSSEVIRRKENYVT